MPATERISAAEYRTKIAKGGGAAALGRLPAGTMNATEAAYAAHLDALKLAGDVLWWAFETVKLRIGKGCWYTPDFLVMLSDGQLEVHETKGFWRDDARVKIKAAAVHFPIPFFGIKRDGAGWTREAFS